MITLSNFKDVLLNIGYSEISQGVLTKQYPHFEHYELRVDFNTRQIIYPAPITLGDTTTSNFEHPENFVVLECVTRLLDKGYRPEHIGLEKRWQLGRGSSGGKADICVTDANGDMLFIVECKTAGKEYNEELKKMAEYGGQLFSYLQQERSTRWLVLYASDFANGSVKYDLTIIKSTDDANILKMSEKDKSVVTYAKARTVEDLFEVWDETYSKATHNDIIFDEDSVAYNIGERQLRKKDLKDFTPDDKIVNRFEEILRHNNVSDKENAFNRLIALFICKLVDEIKKGDNEIVDFQYKVGTDTYESLQDRLQYLHKVGMQEFMQEEINYIDDGYADRVFGQLSQSKRKKAIEDLRNTLRILKYYTNNDFTFKDVHNEELFYQNGKVLVEVVQLFEKYRIVYPSKHQFLGDLFEQLLNKGFKQNEGQFFTPMPITRFIWDCLPLEKVLHTKEGYRLPKIIDYACGAGHFLTEAVEAINAYFHRAEADDQIADNAWVEKSLFGVEKDYRLARVAKVCLYMNGAGKGQIVFGDGLEQYSEKGITNGTFDILVANPPYSVDAFKAHLRLKNNSFEIYPLISNNGNEIETLFVERIAQLLKPNGIAAVILPPSIIGSGNSKSEEAAREQILKNFNLRAIVQFGNQTFGATGTGTTVLFLEKFNEPPKRNQQLFDSIDLIFSNDIDDDWEERDIFESYVKHIGVNREDYISFLRKNLTLDKMSSIAYFNEYLIKFKDSSEFAQIQKKKSFSQASTDEQSRIIMETFYDVYHKLEREKMYYFALVYKQRTLIISAPIENKEQKRFLGYSWSTRRGNEGIQIDSPGGLLYDDKDRYANDTLASLVRNTYYDIFKQIEKNKQYYRYARLQDMIDFSRSTFTKAITLLPKITITSQFEPFKIGTWIIEKEKSKIQVNDAIDNTTGKYPFFTSGESVLSADSYLVDGENIFLSTGGNAVVKYYKGKASYSTDTYVIKSKDEKVLLTRYLYYALESSTSIINAYFFKGKTLKHLQKDDFKEAEFLIKPPTPVQEQIVSECSHIDEEYVENEKIIEQGKLNISAIFEKLQSIPDKKILNLSNPNDFDIGIGKRVLASEVNPEYSIPVYSANVFMPFGMINKQLLTDFTKDSILWGIDGDWMVNTIPANKPFYPTDHCGVLRIKSNDVLPKYMAYLLHKEGERAGFSRSNRASIDRIEGLSVEVVNIKEQQRAIEQIELIESEIRKAQEIIDSCPARKKAILDKYLN